MAIEHQMVQVDDYAEIVGPEVVARVKEKAKPLQHLHITNVNSTLYGGGVSTLLGSLTLLMNCLGIRTGWRVIQGSPDFFSITKKMHNALQGGELDFDLLDLEQYENMVYENAVRTHLNHDRVIIHDPQPLPMIAHYQKRGPWIWRCHIDLSHPHPQLWQYLMRFVEQYDAVILSLKEYSQELETPQVFFMPAIDPFTMKNRPMDNKQVLEKLEEYNIPTDRPLVTQISRFDRWKDPAGVIEAFRLARQDVDAVLVLLGNIATDDPEGSQLYGELVANRASDVFIISAEDTALVNALQRQSAVILQKSIREGFGLTVAEAMWKGTPVIGGDVGGIRYQIKDGINGYLVSSVEQTAGCIVKLLKDEELRYRMGLAAHETVRNHFLLIRLVEQYLDLLSSFEALYRLRM